MRRLTILGITILLLGLAFWLAVSPGSLAAPVLTESCWPTYQRGAVNPNVSLIKAFLKDRGYYSGTLGQFFTLATRSAVIDFQSANGLAATGVVDSATWESLLLTISQGSAGNSVRVLQSWLRHIHGYTATPINGNFDAATDASVRAYQQANGLTVDGIVGSQTWSTLACYNDPPPLPTPAPTATPTPAPAPTPTPTPPPAACWPIHSTTFNSVGPNVYAIQYLLRHHGYILTVDGIYGSGTAGAVQSFQTANGLSADGVIGPQTWPVLVVSVQQGNYGNDAVFAVQHLLVFQWGYSLVIDGDFGPATQAAVVDFQSQQGLPATGVVDTATWSALVCLDTARAGLGAAILADSNIELLPYHPAPPDPIYNEDGATAYDNIMDTANGLMAQNSCYENAPCGETWLDVAMLAGMVSLADTYSYLVTSIAGGSHSVNSLHYLGLAFDVGVINGLGVSASNPYVDGFMNQCLSLGATEVLGPGDAGHSTHIHCAWP